MLRGLGPPFVVALAGLLLSCASSEDLVAEAPPGSSDGGVSDGPVEGSSEGGCIPKSCIQLEAQCGTVPDQCGATVSCGDCPEGQTCGGDGTNRCGTGACTPKTCALLGASCGLISDGCNDTLDCGDCPAGEVCGASSNPNQCACVPKTCASAGAECGAVPDGCGGTLSCGTCPAGEYCGGGGTNLCGTEPCVALTCSQAGAECGQIADGCGDVLDCGSCSAPETCGGGGSSNLCGCLPTTCGAQGVSCGSISDGCGGTLACGNCPATQTCSSGTCGCTSTQHWCGSLCISDGACCTDSDCSGLLVCATAGSSCSCRTSPSRIPIYRSYYAPTQDHFFSPAQSEGPAAGYQDEGIRFYLYPAPCQWGLTPFYRILNPNSGEHFYTNSVSERDSLIAGGWIAEGDIGCIAAAPDCGAVALSRLVWPGGMHMFTPDPNERDALLVNGWTLEGTAGFVWTAP